MAILSCRCCAKNEEKAQPKPLSHVETKFRLSLAVAIRYTAFEVNSRGHPGLILITIGHCELTMMIRANNCRLSWSLLRSCEVVSNDPVRLLLDEMTPRLGRHQVRLVVSYCSTSNLRLRGIIYVSS
jgi:hypothetical protein